MDITLLIGTCDKYSFLWNNFTKLSDKYLTFDYSKKIFVSETKTAKYKNYTTRLFETGMSWSDRMLSTLNEIDTKYTFFVLDDYYFVEKIDNKEMKFHLDLLEEMKGNKVMFDYKCPHLKLGKRITDKKRGVYELNNNSNYLTSLQPSLWKTSFLKECMQHNWSPWEFEIKGSEKRQGKDNRNYLSIRTKKPYFNIVRNTNRGLKIVKKWQGYSWEKIKEKENLEELNLRDTNT